MRKWARGARAWGVLAGLGCCAVMIGCVTTSRPPAAGAAPAKAQAAGDDLPLVPVPPVPLGGASSGKAVAAPAEDPPAPVPDAKAPAVTADQLLARARKRYAGMDSYIVRLLRRETVNGKVGPDELILFKFRQSPWSAYLKWLSEEGRGREVVFVKGQHQGKIHTLLAAGDIPFVPAGRRMALSPDSVLVRTACRHPITEAGLGASIDRIAALIAATGKSDASQGTLRLVGPVTRQEFEKPAHGLEHTIPPGLDPTLPRGGRRAYFFNPESDLPTLVTTRDDQDREVEYYRYDRLQPSVKLDDDDFDPDRLWGKLRPAGAAMK